MSKTVDPTIQLVLDHARLITALREIARGREDCGRPLDGDTAREIARRALVETGWAAPWGADVNR